MAREGRETDEVLVCMAQRLQSQLERQLTLVERLQVHGHDESLADLAELRTSLQRSLRGSENVLVLAGAQQGPRSRGPRSVADVLADARAGVEDVARIGLGPAPDASIAPRAVAGLVALFTELLTHAVAAASPTSRVEVASARSEDGGVVVEVLVDGPGPSAGEIDELTRRLGDRPIIDDIVSNRVGLFVAARLARRCGVGLRVQQRRGTLAGPGIVVVVHCPPDLLDAVAFTAPDAPRSWNRDPASRNGGRPNGNGHGANGNGHGANGNGHAGNGHSGNGRPGLGGFDPRPDFGVPAGERNGRDDVFGGPERSRRPDPLSDPIPGFAPRRDPDVARTDSGRADTTRADATGPGLAPADRPWSDRPPTDRPLADRPLADRPLADRPLADRPLADRPLPERARSDPSRADDPRSRRPLPDRPRSGSWPYEATPTDQPLSDHPALDPAPSGSAPSGSAPSGSAPSGATSSGLAPSGSAQAGLAQPDPMVSGSGHFGSVVSDADRSDAERRDLPLREPARREPASRDPVRRDPVRREPLRRDPVRREQGIDEQRSNKLGSDELGSDNLSSDNLSSDEPRGDEPGSADPIRAERPRSDVPRSDLRRPGTPLIARPRRSETPRTGTGNGANPGLPRRGEPAAEHRSEPLWRDEPRRPEDPFRPGGAVGPLEPPSAPVWTDEPPLSRGSGDAELFGPLTGSLRDKMRESAPTPIYEAVASAWFVDDDSAAAGVAGGPPPDWNTPSDAEWRAASERAARPAGPPEQSTSAGLPRRRPGTQMVAPPLHGDPVPQGGSRDREPEKVRERLAVYQQGLERGRHRATDSDR